MILEHLRQQHEHIGADAMDDLYRFRVQIFIVGKKQLPQDRNRSRALFHQSFSSGCPDLRVIG
jgi:hypothetical protein